MKTERIRNHFRAQVPNYAALMERLIPFYEIQRSLILQLMRRDDASVPPRVLDLGCGPGLMANAILAEFPKAQLTLIDLTPEMIEACRSRFERFDNVTYRIGDFRLDDLGEAYDVVLASLSLHHLELSERPACARRILQSLKPGGQLITAEVIVDESPTVRERQYELWRRFMTAQGEDGETWYQKHLAKDHPVEIAAWVSTLTEAGFVSAGCFWRYLNFAIIAGCRSAL